MVPDLGLERELFCKAGGRYVAGCDEVGRGALAGGVMVGIVVVDMLFVENLLGIRDSKYLSAKRRVDLFIDIQNWATSFSVGQATAF